MSKVQFYKERSAESKAAFVHNLNVYARRYQNQTGFGVDFDLNDPMVVGVMMDFQSDAGFTPGSRSASVFTLATFVLRKQEQPLRVEAEHYLDYAARAIGCVFYDVRHGNLRLIDDEMFARLAKLVKKFLPECEEVNRIAQLGVDMVKACMPQTSAAR